MMNEALVRQRTCRGDLEQVRNVASMVAAGRAGAPGHAPGVRRAPARRGGSTRRSIWSMRWSRRRPRGQAPGSIELSLLRMPIWVILDELGYLPFSAQAGGALLFHLLSKLTAEHTSVVITTNLSE